MKRLLFIFCLVFVGLFAVSCAKQQSNEIVLGAYGDVSGDTSQFGTAARNGMNMAAEEINNAGGINGKKIKLIFEDDRGTATESRNAVSKLIDRDGATIIIGQLTSTCSIAGGEICKQRGVPMVSPAATNPKVTAISEQIFRVCFTDNFQGTVLANFAINTLKSKRAAIFMDKSQDYSVGLADNFEKAFTGHGGEIVSKLNYSGKDTDFKSQLLTIKGSNPDVIMIPGYYAQVQTIARQAREIGITVPLIGGDGWDSMKDLLAGGAQALEGCYFTTHFVPSQDPKAAEFAKKFKEKYGNEPDAMATLSYDAMYVVADALKRANSTDPKAIQSALATVKDLPAVTGVITIDSERNAKKQAVMLTIAKANPGEPNVQGYTFKYMQTIKPEELQGW